MKRAIVMITLGLLFLCVLLGAQARAQVTAEDQSPLTLDEVIR